MLHFDISKDRIRANRAARCLCAVFFCSVLASSASAQIQVLESSALRLEVNTSTYSYKVIDKATGSTLLTQAQSAFNVGGTQRIAQSATLTSATATSLSFNLNLPSVGPAQAVFAFNRPDVLQVNLTGATSTQVREAFVDQGEHYYGLLEYPFAGAIDNRGLNRDMIGYQNAAGTNYANARAPYYVTDAGYGIYTKSNALGRYQVAISWQTAVQFDEPQMEYYVMAGTPKKVAQTYAEIAGGPVMPPDWALGTSWWRDDHHQDLGGGVTTAQALALRDAQMLQQHQIPAASIWIDRPWTIGTSGWGGVDAQGNFIWDDEGNPSGNGFPNPDALISTLNNTYGTNLMLWVANRTDFDASWLANAPVGVDTFAEAFDMRDPLAVEWVKQSLGSLADRGIRGFKIDRSEENEVPDAFENLNTLLFHQAVHEMWVENGVTDAYPFARSVYDTGRQWIGVWNGDTQTNFSGLDVSLKNMLRSASMNFSVWGSDTGGYSASQLPSKTLYARWQGFSAYSPIMETMLGPNRVIWDDYDQEMIDITRTHAQTHHQMIPYVRSYLHQARTKGIGVVRPMVFEYPDDPNVKDMYNQYMYGDALLVAPVITDTPNRSVYLPAGDEWLDYNDKVTVHQGGQTLQLTNVPLDKVPVYVRRGGIVVRGDIVKGNNNWTPNWAPSLDIEIYLPNGDRSNSFAYYTGSGVENIAYTKSGGTTTTTFNNLSANGAVKLFLDDTTNIMAREGLLGVTRNGSTLNPTDYQYNQSTRMLAVNYTGATQLVVAPTSGLLVLTIDRATGQGQIDNVGQLDASLKNYQIVSARGSLDAGDWVSLSDQGLAGWSEDNPTQNRLAELRATGGSTVGGQNGLGLGSLFSPNHSAFGVNDGEDLVFEYTTPDGNVIQSLVEYTGVSLQPSNLLLTVDPTTGDGRLTNTSKFSVTIDEYEILSDDGSLNPAGWQSLDDQNIGTWAEASPDTHQLVELEALGTLQLPAGASYNLGKLFTPGASQDLTLEFGIVGQGTLATGAVVFALQGDYNRNGVVDAADYVVWRNSEGKTVGTGTGADGNSDGTIDQGDYAVWRSRYGAMLPAASAASQPPIAIPEASTFLLAVSSVLALGVRLMHRQK